ncbi:hypothetical protein [Microbacterium sp. Bi121]|uniref:hypothetical protein n=1 Tax=Microbacterium sp. Bi121 TaxID=2822348 RepID=UPI001D6FB159|nr:hypothetical protein [Microbacterium sp. Bi121]CAH0141105.1 hypothetical protein SRABI121_01008 [Microbacterium sp. Bi121]
MAFALALTVILALLAVFQIALAAGAPWGHFAWGGQHRVLPRNLRIGSGISIVIYAVIAFVAWERVGASSVLPDVVAQVAMWVVFAYFAIGIVMNAISRSKQERYTMTPIVLALAVLSLLIAMGLGELAMAA